MRWIKTSRYTGASGGNVLVLMASAASAALHAMGSIASAQSFTPLGHLSGRSPFFSAASGVSADGTVVVGYSTSGSSGSYRLEAFRWTAATGMVGLGLLPGRPESFAYGVSGDGSVVVGSARNSSGYPEAFRWTTLEGMQSLGDLPGGEFSSAAFGVSLDGSVIVGGGLSAGGGECFRWTVAAGMESIGQLPSNPYCTAFAVSGDGSVVVGGSSCTNSGEAFRWTAAEGMQGIGDFAGTEIPSSQAWGISADGTVIVGMGAFGGCSMDGVFGAASRWTAAGGMQWLGNGSIEFATSSSTNGANADGSIVVGSITRGWFGGEAFLWTPALGVVSVEEHLLALGVTAVTGWGLTSATAISADGLAIVGVGRSPEGREQAWIARLAAPSPDCLADLSGDGRVDSVDFSSFLDAFFSGEENGDFDSSGLVESSDFFAFLAAFFEGCD